MVKDRFEQDRSPRLILSNYRAPRGNFNQRCLLLALPLPRVKMIINGIFLPAVNKIILVGKRWFDSCISNVF